MTPESTAVEKCPPGVIARGAWHAECWHIEHRGDLLDLLTVERAS